MAWVAVAAAATTVVGNKVLNGGSKQTGTATTTQQQQLDPRIGNIVFGSNGNNGLLSQYQGYLNQPQSQALANYGAVAGDYLNNAGSNDLYAGRAAATGLINGNSAPTSTAASASLPAYAVGNMVQAPSQNNVDLSGAYQNFISGGSGVNPYLNSQLQNAVDMTNASYAKNQTDLTNNLMRNVLPSLRSDAVLAGQYGGSREGIAEGNALSDYTNQLNNSNLQLGLANSANTTGAQANTYNLGQDRALAATQGLGAQQYATAIQNANTKNQAEFMNVANSFDASKYNAGLAQQTGLANQQAQLTTNAQNNSAALAGAGLLSGLSGTAYTGAQNDQNYGINRATQVNGLLAPYLSANSSSTTSQPLYSNSTGNLLGGALLGSQLGSGLFGGTYDASGLRNSNMGTSADPGTIYSGIGSAGNWNAGLNPSGQALPVPSLPFLTSF